jgi:hypothetical protein
MSKTPGEYHHYIPRFLLRNFQHHNKLLNSVTLQNAEPQFLETFVIKTFGRKDMYKGDVTPSSDKNRAPLSAAQQVSVEKELRKLEGAAAMVIAEIKKAHDSNQLDVQLSSAQHATLLKFVFIMKYRKHAHVRTLQPSAPENYEGYDKARLLEYMREKGHRRPIDIWLEPIVEIIKLELDGNDEWPLELQKHIYIEGIMWAELIMRLMYPVVCTPSQPDEDFVLSEHAYCLHEGPVYHKYCTELHIICVLTPRLALLLRQEALPEIVEDKDEAVKTKKQGNLKEILKVYPNPDGARSVLDDVPFAKPRSTYIKDMEGKLVLTREGAPANKLPFPLLSLDSAAIQTINSVILEEAADLPAIVSKSRKGLQLALKAYLSRPTNLGTFSVKTVRGDNDPMIAYLKRLERIAKLLGSSVTAVCKTIQFHQWAVEDVVTWYQIDGSRTPLYNCKIFLMHIVIALHVKFNTDTIKACDTSAEGHTGGFVRQIYDDVQNCSVGCAPRLASMPLSVWVLAWDHLKEVVLLRSVIGDEGLMATGAGMGI